MVEHDRSGNVTVRSFARKLEDDDTCQGLLGVLGARDGGEFGADLDGGRDDVLGALAAGLGRVGVVDGIVFVGVVRLWDGRMSTCVRAYGGGGFATREDGAVRAVAHAGESSEL